MNRIVSCSVLAVLAVAVTLLVLAGCARDRTPPPTSVSVDLAASTTVNPDRNGRASPILVRVYELRSSGNFESADFFALLEQDLAVLGSDQLSRWEYQLEPGERVTLSADFQPGSSYIGVVAAYRDIEHARWRALQPLESNQANDLEVVVDRAEVTIGRR